MRRADVTVQIMLGGKSTRMGRDKALVELGGHTLLDRALDIWKGYGAGLQLSVGSEARRGLAPAGICAVVDRYPERGPLGGLHAGLTVCPTPLLLLTAVDSPFLTPALADGLLDAIEGADACVYTLDGRSQPLFGLYRTTCLLAAEGLLEEGNNRLRALLDRVRTVCLPAADPGPFRNLNTPEELEQARRAFGCDPKG